MMKKIKCSMLCGILLILMGMPVFAQTSQAILFYKISLYDTAREMLLKEVKSGGTTAAEAYFYLGQIALEQQNKDSANYYFTQGKTADPEYPYNLIGQGELLLNKDTKQAEALFDQAQDGKYKKDPLVNLAIARAYQHMKHPDYSEMLKELKEKYGKLPDVYILEGDDLLAQGKTGEALTLYEQAIYFDPKCEEAYLKYAHIYKDTQPMLALETLKKLLALIPNSTLALREIAEVNFSMGNFEGAAKNYQQFLARVSQPGPRDLNRYATILYYNQEFEKALTYIDKSLQSHPKDLVMNRLKMYICLQQNKGEAALQQANLFMNQYKPEQYIALDYIFYGRILKNNQQYEEALQQFKKILSMDPDKTEVHRDLAETYEAMNHYQEAIGCYQQLMAHSQKVELSDYLSFGKEYYFAADHLKNSADSIHQKSYLLKADSLFAIVSDKAPTNCLGYFWRARALSLVDPDATQGLAKPYYEKVLTLLEPEGKDKKKMAECYNYLGYYYYVKNELTTSLDYWNKTLSIDPESEVARKAIDGIKMQLK